MVTERPLNVDFFNSISKAIVLSLNMEFLNNIFKANINIFEAMKLPLSMGFLKTHLRL